MSFYSPALDRRSRWAKRVARRCIRTSTKGLTSRQPHLALWPSFDTLPESQRDLDSRTDRSAQTDQHARGRESACKRFVGNSREREYKSDEPDHQRQLAGLSGAGCQRLVGVVPQSRIIRIRILNPSSKSKGTAVEPYRHLYRVVNDSRCRLDMWWVNK